MLSRKVQIKEIAGLNFMTHINFHVISFQSLRHILVLILRRKIGII